MDTPCNTSLIPLRLLRSLAGAGAARRQILRHFGGIGGIARIASEVVSRPMMPSRGKWLTAREAEGAALGDRMEIIKVSIYSHGRTAWGVRGGRRWPQAARPADGPPLTRPRKAVSGVACPQGVEGRALRARIKL
jgi:hypothetical protein